MTSSAQLKIALCSDHAGFELKNKISDYLKTGDAVEIKDFGAYSAMPADYPDYAHPMAKAVERGDFDFGIAFCGTGNGINMTVNKHQGIRSALCWMPELAELARRHNDANVLAIPARFLAYELTVSIVEKFLSTEFDGGRHLIRVEKMRCN
ncbi:MAG: ribose 5-phosphate isomerase B [Prevotellaceae bacterium]|jgi:ribose 5-phosphate isomerase B|nr:ribose 5-phosphate isomerase B [Prevotellaceae bacterium]